jgi:hypothetical protein
MRRGRPSRYNSPESDSHPLLYKKDFDQLPDLETAIKNRFTLYFFGGSDSGGVLSFTLSPAF